MYKFLILGILLTLASALKSSEVGINDWAIKSLG